MDRVGLMNLGRWRMKGLKGFGGVFFTFTTPLFLIPLNWGNLGEPWMLKRKNLLNFSLWYQFMYSILINK